MTDLGWREMTPADHRRVISWNRELQEDEGSEPMPIPAIAARLDRLLAAGHWGVLFERSADPVGYALMRPAQPDVEGARGVYIQQFHIDRTCRRAGVGRAAFTLLRDEALAGYERILLEAVATNPAGQAFWRAMGFADYSIRFQWRRDQPGR